MKTLIINTIQSPNYIKFQDKKLEWEGRASTETITNIQNILGENKPELIAVLQGEGGFTSARVGVVIGNALAKIWNIKICSIFSESELENAEKLDEIAPYYPYPPNITPPKC